MPVSLLKELKSSPVETRSYKHSAPTGLKRPRIKRHSRETPKLPALPIHYLRFTIYLLLSDRIR
jgi:hypothetical protein